MGISSAILQHNQAHRIPARGAAQLRILAEPYARATSASATGWSESNKESP